MRRDTEGRAADVPGAGSATGTAWYVAYGSNLASLRLRHYLAGGCPNGALRTYDGCRDAREPLSTRPVELAGGLLFAGESRVWTGGIAYYDADADGTVAARAYLLTTEQVNDVVAQEMRLSPGTDLRLTAGRPGRRTVSEAGYDTAVRLPDVDGLPALTIASSRRLRPAAPSRGYLWWLCAGLRETYGWAPDHVAGYLAAFPGVAGSWSMGRLRDLAAEAAPTARTCDSSGTREVRETSTARPA